MEMIYRGFDGLDVAFPGRISPEFEAALTEAQERAKKDKRDTPIEFRGVGMMVAETGMRGGFAFRCDTGLAGMKWFFKRPHERDPWGIFVSVKSLALALHGLGGVRARMFEFLDRIGAELNPEEAHINRVDYAVDILAPDFELVRPNFVIPSRTSWGKYEDPELAEFGCGDRVTGVRIGKMPGRQINLYDKREDIIIKQKKEWWKIYNDRRVIEGKALLDSKDRNSSLVWRVEFRAGKTYLKDRWGIITWTDLDDKIGDLIMRAASDIRYTIPQVDRNRSRWPNDPIWDLCKAEISGDLFEMMCQSEPGAIREVVRDKQIAMYDGQIQGLSASLGTVLGYDPDQSDEAVEEVTQRIKDAHRSDKKRFRKSMAKAGARFTIIDG